MIYFILILICILSLYLIVILISFDPADPSWMQSVYNNKSIYNIGGLIGAQIADFLLFCFGIVSYIIPLIITYYGWILCTQKINISFFTICIKIVKICIFLFICCILIQLICNDIFYFSPGGIIGNILLDFMKIYPYSVVYINSILLFYKFHQLFLYYIKKVYDYIKCNLLDFISLILFKNRKSSKLYVNKKNFYKIKITPSVFCSTQNTTVNSQITQLSKNNTELNLDHNIFVKYSKQPHHNMTDYINKTKFLSPFNTLSTRNYKIKKYLIPKFNLHNHYNINNYYIKKYNHCFLYHNDKTFNIFQNKYIKHTNLKNPISLQKKSYKNDVSSIKNLNEINIHTKNYPIQKKPILLNQKSYQLKLQQTNDILNANLISNNNNHSQNDCYKKFILPDFNLLTKTFKKKTINYSQIQSTAQLIEKKLLEYRIIAKVIKIISGPVITRFKIDLSAGVKSSKISSLSRDLARALSVASVQVIEVIPGTPYIGLEIPNTKRYTVYLQDIICSDEFKKNNSPLALILGQSITGVPVIKDLRYMPHLLVAGTTGSGKSVGINAMIISMLYTATPEDVRFIMIDPKILELSVYSNIPHLLTHVITDTQDVESILQWCIKEMENRYKFMSILGVRNIESFNLRIQEEYNIQKNKSDYSIKLLIEKNIDKFQCCMSYKSKKLPYIVIIIDEFSDLIITTAKKIEVLIIRLTQKARAAGIHIILSTQRPSVDVITGVIKANIPARIAFTVSSKIDSRTILGQSGAESLLGMGDMLYLPPNSSDLIRIHGVYITDKEIHTIIQFWKNQTIKSKYLYKI